ncbi:MAG: TIGR02117 family protein [Hyphomicrobiales bacterium]|nr:TIGR02117 family protein [Hyphomicrobiales bacterium]
MTLINIAKRAGLFVTITPVFVGTAYLLAATIGGLIPSPQNIERHYPVENQQTFDLYLLSTVLHVDIAVPLSKEVKRQFAFLKDDGFPLSHPKLDYLVIGWGSRRFYTSTKTLMDIGPGPVYTAITGDTSVLHIIPSKDISKLPDVRKITITQAGFRSMMNNIRASFAHSTDGKPMMLKGISHGLSDAFYQAKGGFNIFRPCNIWTARMLRSAGVKTGIWTPTTYSLMLSLK